MRRNLARDHNMAALKVKPPPRQKMHSNVIKPDRSLAVAFMSADDVQISTLAFAGDTFQEVEAETATPPPPPRQQQEPSDTIVEEAVEEASRPKRAVKPAGFYRKHASKLDNIIEREAHLAAKARKRKVAKCLPENALEFLGTLPFRSSSLAQNFLEMLF